MEIVQKVKSNKHTFTFGNDQFNFAYDNKAGSGDTDMNYATFPNKSSIQIEQNEWLRNVGYLWCALGVFQLGYAIYSDASLSGKGFWIMIGLACIAWAHFSKVTYSVFTNDQGNVFVIHDENHDKIISELNARKKSQLLDWYGTINPENDLAQEIGKFKWLLEHEIISQEEFDKKIAEAELLHKRNDEPPAQHDQKPKQATGQDIDFDALINQINESDYSKNLATLNNFVENKQVLDSIAGNAGFILFLSNDSWAAAYRENDKIGSAYGSGTPDDHVKALISSTQYGDASEPVTENIAYASEYVSIKQEVEKSHGSKIRGLSYGVNTFNYAFEGGRELDFKLVNDNNNVPAVRVFWEQW